MPTSRTDPAVMHGRPSLAPTATRTHKTLRPAQRHEVSATGSVRGKPTLELQDRLAIVLGHALHYRQGQVESIGEPGYANYANRRRRSEAPGFGIREIREIRGYLSGSSSCRIRGPPSG